MNDCDSALEPCVLRVNRRALKGGTVSQAILSAVLFQSESVQDLHLLER